MSTADTEIRAWDARTGKLLDALTKQLQSTLAAEKDVYAIEVIFSPSGRALAGGLRRYDYKPWSTEIWNSRAGKHLYSLPGGGKAVAFRPDSKVLATGSEEGAVRLWEMSGGRLVGTFEADSGVSTLAFSPDGRLFAVGTRGNIVKVCKLAAQKPASAQVRADPQR